MGTVWARRREDLLSDCLVSPDVFIPMVDRLAEFVVPYQHVLETEAGQRNVHLYLQGLLSHLPGKNAEDIATFVDVERQVMQEFIGTAPWDHRPLIEVLVAQVACRLGQPDGIIAFDPSSFPKRGTHSVGVKRQWCGHRGKVDRSICDSRWVSRPAHRCSRTGLESFPSPGSSAMRPLSWGTLWVLISTVRACDLRFRASSLRSIAPSRRSVGLARL
jgi:hypothetical protein